MTEPTVAPPATGFLSDPIGSLGKVVGLVAGAGIVLYLIGVAVLWQRLRNAGLQAHDVIAVIPRDQLAAAGAGEAALSAVSGAVFGVCLYAAYRGFRKAQEAAEWGGVRGRWAGWVCDRPVIALTAVAGVSCALLGPFSAINALFLALFLAIVFVGCRSAHRSLISEPPEFRTSALPWIRVAAGLSAAVFLGSVVRQRNFPDRFSCASIVLEGKQPTMRGLYLGATSDAVVLGRPGGRSGTGAAGSCSSEMPHDPETLLVARGRIARVTLSPGPEPAPPARSLLHEIGLEVECISPVCRWKGENRSVLDLFVRAR